MFLLNDACEDIFKTAAIPDCEISCEWDHVDKVYRVLAECKRTGKSALYLMAKIEIMLCVTTEELAELCRRVVRDLAVDVAEIRKDA